MHSPPRILIVDDNEMNRDILVTRLSTQNYELLQAADGEEALAAAAQHLPDLILLDVMMPKIDGMEVCRRLKADPKMPFMPIILVTAKAASADVVAGLEARVEEQLSELERASRLQRFLSPQIANLILSAGDDRVLESHRRVITVVFCDLRGFTAFSELTEPEEVMSVLKEYHATLGGLIHKYEGTVERFAGDGIMIFFNDPLPCPDPSLRAVQMALEMREQVGELLVKWRKQGYELGFGVGIAHGYATLGRIGFEGRFDYGAIGTVVNLAARLCADAKDGQILVDPKVQAAIEERTSTEPAGELVLKGFHRPVRAFNVCALRSHDAPIPPPKGEGG